MKGINAILLRINHLHIFMMLLGTSCSSQFLNNVYALEEQKKNTPSIQRFESAANPGYFIRHQNGIGRLDSFVAPYQDAEWRVIPGLAAGEPGHELISLESVNYPGTYLRHRGPYLYIDKPDGSTLFQAEATFKIVQGLSDPNKISLQAYNLPLHFLRQAGKNDARLQVAPVTTETDRQEATFACRDFDWSWVKGAVFVPTNVVNQIQQWDEYDPVINDRELYYASIYGLNCVRIYLHYLVWEKDKDRLLRNLEDFLSRADKYKLKTEIVFFDDCWDPNPVIGAPYPAPRFGVHNSRWVQCPGNYIKENYAAYKSRLKGYVKDVVNAHKNDGRIIFWEPYNEPGNNLKGIYYEATNRLLFDSRNWIKETGTSIPLTSTDFAGTIAPAVSDFFSWHVYDRYAAPVNPGTTLCTECMNRQGQDIPGIVSFFKGKTGFIIWEAGIGRDNCRYPWGNTQAEPAVPFHGLFYPDGHPWSVEDAKALRGDDLRSAPLFAVTYFGDTQFLAQKKTSVTPLIDFDLGNEFGTGSPDASAGIGIDNFSIRWTGLVAPPATGNYTFSADSDNIVRLWLDGKLIVNKTDNTRSEAAGTIRLTAGRNYPFKAEYVHAAGDASLHVYWSGPGLSKQVLRGRGGS